MADEPHSKASTRSRVEAYIRGAVAFTFEGASLKWLHSKLRFFVAGSEKAVVDCGLWIRESVERPPDYSTALFETVISNQERYELAALDCKTIMVWRMSSWKGGQYCFGFETTEGQEACAAFIVFSPAAPNIIALIPAEYLHRATKSQNLRKAYGREIPMTGAPIEPFPLEWCPFVMPAEDLLQALTLLRVFCLGRSSTW